MNTVPLHKRLKELLGAQKAGPEVATMSVQDLRSRARGQIDAWRAAGVIEHPVERCEDRLIPGDGGSIVARFYWPSSRPGLPIVLYFHGGGWVLGDVEIYDGICRGIAHASGAIVVSVDYRRAPEHRCPAALDDCLAVLRWTGAHAAEIGGDASSIFVAGDSAGGNLAAMAAIESRGTTHPLKGQILIYPVVDSPESSHPSISEFAPGNEHGQSWELYLRFVRMYLGDIPSESHARFAPMCHGKLTDLPPALIITAYYDLFRDEAEAYALRMSFNGVDVKLWRFEDVNHGFLHWLGVVPAADIALREISEWIRASVS